MASKGIGVPFVADVGPFLKGTKDVEGALDKVIDSLDGVAQEGKRSADLIETSFEGMSKDVQAADRRLEEKFNAFFESVEDDSTSASNKMTREFKDAFDDVERAARKSGDKVGDHLSDGVTHGAGKGKHAAAEVGTEIGQELTQNIGEQIGSGGAGGLADIFLGTIGGLASIPGLGAAIAGIGVGALIIKQIFDGMAAEQEARKAKIKELGAQMYEAYSDGVSTQQEKEDLATKALGVDSWFEASKKIKEIADRTGLPFITVYDAVVNHSAAAKAQIEAVEKAHTRTVNAGGSTGKGGGATGMSVQYDKAAVAAREAKDAINDAEAAQLDVNQAIADQWLLTERNNAALKRQHDRMLKILATQNAINKIAANQERYLSS